MHTASYTPEELMAVVISREVRDGETVAVGTLSPIPAAGVLLARERHAARGTYLFYKSDYQRDAWWPFRHGSMEFYEFAQRGRLDMFFVSAAQIDQYGNINLNVIGDPAQPRVRLPGGAGTPMLWAMVRRVIVFKTDHSPRAFVPQVDFITCPGSHPPGVSVRGGLYKVVTPLAVLCMNRAQQRLALESISPGSNLAAVQANTGFALPLAEPILETPAPSPDELTILRSTVRRHLERIYPHFAASALR
ncbi:MAG TPA: CoA-transferase [Candidatus Tectomicrobia bacterium]|nr:CoA-transferase [Candidatus Tectomicrobia bacterium]